MIVRHALLGLSAAHLRAPFLMITPLLPILQAELGLSPTHIGALTALPLLVFAATSPAVSTLLARLGLSRLFGAALLLIAGGAVIRSYLGSVGLFAGTLLLSVGIAVGNVLLPSLVKAWYPGREGLATGASILVMNGMIALWMIGVLPVSEAVGWRLTLASWALSATGAGLFWLLRPAPATTPTAPAAHAPTEVHVFRHAAAWWVAASMGVQSLFYFTLTTWLPYWLLERSLSLYMAGTYLFLFQLTGLVGSFFAPLLASGPRRRDVGLLTAAAYPLAMYAVFHAPSGLPLTLAVGGLGIIGGAMFSLCMLAFSVRAATPLIAARLSGTGLSIAYLLAAVGPVGLGRLYESVGAWEPLQPLFYLAGLFLMISSRKALDFPRIGETE